MAEPRTPLPNHGDPELERRLSDLGSHLAIPATPDMTARVRERLAGDQSSAPIVDANARRRRLILTTAAAILILLGALALFPQARTAIADRLGIGGVTIRWLEDGPSPSPSPVGVTMMLGHAVTLAEARDAVEFPVRVPTQKGFAAPIEVYVSGRGRDAMVSFVYPAHPGLPAGEVLGVGALLTQFPGETGREFILKGLGLHGTDEETILEAVSVNGHPGFWIAGAPHGVFLACLDGGECREERYRLAENVLLWEQDGVTFRLESALPRDEAIAIAESAR
jgi:hypothetical protein